MKNLKSMRLLFAAIFAVTLVSIAITSCYKDPAQPFEQTIDGVENQHSGKYRTEIVLTDPSGRNTAVLEVSTDDADMLDWFTAEELVYSIHPGDPSGETSEETDVESLDIVTEAGQTADPGRLVFVQLKKTEAADEEGEHVVLFSNALQDKLNAIGATVRFVIADEVTNDEALERGPISGTPKRIKLNKYTPSKPALVSFNWRCGNNYYVTIYSWPANNGAQMIITICPSCSASVRYIYYYDYYAAPGYSAVYLSWKSTACN